VLGTGKDWEILLPHFKDDTDFKTTIASVVEKAGALVEKAGAFAEETGLSRKAAQAANLVHVEDYEYVNARVKGMKSHLLPRQRLEAIASQKQIGMVLSELDNTAYGPQVQETVARYKQPDFACVDEVLRKNLRATFDKLSRIAAEASGEPTVILRVLLAKWTLNSVKAVLRAKHAEAPAEEVLETVAPTRELDEADLRELARQKDVRSVAGLLHVLQNRYAKPLLEKMEEYEKTRDLAVLENGLDEFYYKDCLAELRGACKSVEMMRDLVRTEIDAVNMKMVIATVLGEVPGKEAARFFVAGGKEFDRQRLAGLAESKDLDELVSRLGRSAFAKMVARQGQKRRLSAFEREFEKYLVGKGISLSRQDPLAAGVLIGFVYSKQREVVNLRIIAKGIATGIPAEKIKAELYE